jgi:hypothetical protein
MKVEALKKRLDRNRPMTSVTIRIPEDVVEDLKRIAPLLGFSGYQPLIRAYIGQGLRIDLERFEGDATIGALISSLKRRGVSDEIISEALSEIAQS